MIVIVDGVPTEAEVPPGTEPVTLDEAKAHLRLGAGDAGEDDVIRSAITEARGWVEQYTDLVLVRRQLTENISSFAKPLRKWPIVSIDAVTYVGAEGVEQELPVEGFHAQISQRPAALLPLSGWPALLPRSPIAVKFTAGFADFSEINALSPNIIRAIKTLVTEFYDNRGAPEMSASAEGAAKRLCRPFRIWRT
ncbi:hypothetical protein BH11PSE5_BH11PSE5_20750 [soil metagenome]